MSDTHRDHVLSYYEAEDYRIIEEGDDNPEAWPLGLHVLTYRERGDGGESPWWMYVGPLTDEEVSDALAGHIAAD